MLVKIGDYNILDPSVVLGHEASVGHHNVIQKNVSIGDGTVIGNFCEIKENVRIGRNCVIQGRIRIAENTVIGDNVTLKYGTIITRYARIEDDVFIGPNVITLGGNHLRESINGTVIDKGCYIGGGTQIMPGVYICPNTVTGVMTFVNHDINDPGIYVGIPAKLLRRHSEDG